MEKDPLSELTEIRKRLKKNWLKSVDTFAEATERIPPLFLFFAVTIFDTNYFTKKAKKCSQNNLFGETIDLSGYFQSIFLINFLNTA